jgi:hypothetical protein
VRGHPGARKELLEKEKRRKVPWPRVSWYGEEEEQAKANIFLNITCMPMASDVYGSMSVRFISVLAKAAEMISEENLLRHLQI